MILEDYSHKKDAISYKPKLELIFTDALETQIFTDIFNDIEALSLFLKNKYKYDFLSLGDLNNKIEDMLSFEDWCIIKDALKE